MFSLKNCTFQNGTPSLVGSTSDPKSSYTFTNPNGASTCSNCTQQSWDHQVLKVKLAEVQRRVGEEMKQADKLRLNLSAVYNDIAKLINGYPSGGPSSSSDQLLNGVKIGEDEQKKPKIDNFNNYDHHNHLFQKSAQTKSSSSFTPFKIQADLASDTDKCDRTSSSSSCTGTLISSSGQNGKSPRGRKRKVINHNNNNEDLHTDLNCIEVKDETDKLLIRRTGLRPRCQKVDEPPPPPPPKKSKCKNKKTPITRIPTITADPLQIQQPVIFVNPNLCKIKIEQDYNPIVQVKEEPVYISDFACGQEEEEVEFQSPLRINYQIFDQNLERTDTVIDQWLSSSVNMARPANVSAEEYALSEPSNLRNIFAHLDFPDLEECRLVNNHWKNQASRVILSRDCCRLKVWCDEDGSCFLHQENKCELIDVVQCPIDVPCSDLTFSGDGNLGSSAVQNILHLHACRLKTLQLSMNSCATPKQVLIQILNLCAQSLEKLIVKHFDYPAWSDEDENLSLPFLKWFEWTDATEIAYKIVQSAPNLEILKGFDLDRDVDAFIAAERIGALKELIVSGHEDTKSLTKLADARPLKLEILDFRLSSVIVIPKLSLAIQRLIDASKDTLKYLSLGEVCFRSGIQIPRLDSLEILDLGQNNGHPCFPSGINLWDTCPNLKTLDCCGLSDCFNWTLYFPPSEQSVGDLKSVHTLRIDHLWNPWMEGLFKLCPNFKKLSIYTDELFYDTLTRVFRLCPHLEELELEARRTIETTSSTVACLDPVITGLSDGICSRLRLRETDVRLKGFELLKTVKSIVDLKELKSLHIINFNHDASSAATFPLSRVAALYGFSLLPDLKVVIDIPAKMSREDIMSVKKMLIPYVTLRRK